MSHNNFKTPSQLPWLVLQSWWKPSDTWVEALQNHWSEIRLCLSPAKRLQNVGNEKCDPGPVHMSEIAPRQGNASAELCSNSIVLYLLPKYPYHLGSHTPCTPWLAIQNVTPCCRSRPEDEHCSARKCHQLKCYVLPVELSNYGKTEQSIVISCLIKLIWTYQG